jgi:hypothetical protein
MVVMVAVVVTVVMRERAKSVPVVIFNKKQEALPVYLVCRVNLTMV